MDPEDIIRANALSNDDLFNPIEEVYNKRMESRINKSKKTTDKTQSQSQSQSQFESKQEKERAPRVVNVRHYSAKDFNPDPIYESSCDEMSSDHDHEHEHEHDHDHNIEEYSIDLAHSPIDFGSESEDEREGERGEDDDEEDDEEGELLIDHTRKAMKKKPPPPLVPDTRITKKAKIEINHDFCFLCDRRSHNKVGHDKINKIMEMIQENLIEKDDGRIARHIHEYYKNEIYEELKKRGDEDVEMWTSRSIRKHISEIMDPRYQLLKVEVNRINEQIQEISKFCFEIRTYEDGKEEKGYDQKALSELRAWILMKEKLLSKDYDKLPLCNKKSKIDLEAAGTVGPKANFTIQKK